MGSVVLSEVAYHAPRHPWPTMLASNSHQSDTLPGDHSYRASTSSRSNTTTPADRDRSSSHHNTSARHHDGAAVTPDSSRLAASSHPPNAAVEPHHHQAPAMAAPPTAHPPDSPRLSPSSQDREQMLHRQPAAPSTDSSSSAHPSPSPSSSPAASGTGSPPRIKVKDLSQIQTLINEDSSSFGLSRSSSDDSSSNPPALAPQYEISGMPVNEIIEMVAGVLTKITTSNDIQHEHLHSHLPSGDGAVSQQTASVISFHGKNKPNISILSYLSRIHKYCPTTYEVFVSLLVYFDRMTNRVNTGPMQSLQLANQRSIEQMSLDTHSEAGADHSPHPPPPQYLDPRNLSQLFVVDSFNIHRLVIAGVTCASKFFSDVFYTNSRYAKVGGLPQAELNHLELQFLLLNDFRLCIPVEELEAYGTMLVEFYAREVIGQRRQDEMEGVHP